jgi:streptomycin 6-kinase
MYQGLTTVTAARQAVVHPDRGAIERRRCVAPGPALPAPGSALGAPARHAPAVPNLWIVPIRTAAPHARHAILPLPSIPVAQPGAPRHDKRMLDPDFVLDQGGREKLITRFGPGVEQWCAALPEMVQLYCLRWDLELDKALSGNSSRVFIGRQQGKRGVVLKLMPDRAMANEEAIALRAWAATPHTVDLLDADLEAGALLLENVEPGTKVSDEPQVPPVNEVAELLTGLRETARYDGAQLPTMAQGMESMFSRIAELLSNPQVSLLAAPQVLDDGYRKARELASNGPLGLLHGDLHLANVLRAGRTRGLVAIDPRPSVGDPTFDAIDWTLDRVASIDEVHDRIERLCKLVPELEPDRLWGWCQATAAALAILLLRRRPPDATTQLLLEVAASN